MTSRRSFVVSSVWNFLRTNALLAVFALLAALPAQAQLLSEDFNSVAGLTGNGWAFANRSQSPNRDWSQGNPVNSFPAHEGATDSYAGANYQSTSTSVGTISNWMLTPMLSLQNGDVISFYTRTVTNSPFPDRLELRLSTNAASVNVGSTPTDVGDFSVLLLSINPTRAAGGYPTAWTQYTATLSGLTGTVTGRFGVRYFVTDGGVNGANSNYIGADTLRVTAPPCPSQGPMPQRWPGCSADWPCGVPGGYAEPEETAEGPTGNCGPYLLSRATTLR